VSDSKASKRKMRFRLTHRNTHLSYSSLQVEQ
jgi:hypothetical protein